MFKIIVLCLFISSYSLRYVDGCSVESLNYFLSQITKLSEKVGKQQHELQTCQNEKTNLLDQIDMLSKKLTESEMVR